MMALQSRWAETAAGLATGWKAKPLNGSALAAVCFALVSPIWFEISFSVAHRRYESLHRYVTRDAQTNKKIAMYTEHADRLLVLMRIPMRKSQIDFRIYRIDFCHEALLMRIPMRKSKSTFHHPLGNYIIIKGVSRKSRSVLARSTLYRGPVA